MILPKLKGGLGLPDIRRYHDACHFSRLIDWHLHARSKDWITIKDSCAQVPLSHVPWISAQATPKEHSTHPLMGPTLTSFRNTCHILKMTPSPGPMTPLTGNPDFPPGLPDSNRHLANTEHKMRARHFFHNDSVISFSDLPSRLPDSTIPFFTFLQITHFLNSTHPVSQWYRDLNPFEALCSNDSPQSHLISTVYSLLFDESDHKSNMVNRKWEMELNLDLPKEEWENIHTHIHLLTFQHRKTIINCTQMVPPPQTESIYSTQWYHHYAGNVTPK